MYKQVELCLFFKHGPKTSGEHFVEGSMLKKIHIFFTAFPMAYLNRGPTNKMKIPFLLLEF